MSTFYLFSHFELVCIVPSAPFAVASNDSFMCSLFSKVLLNEINKEEKNLSRDITGFIF